MPVVQSPDTASAPDLAGAEWHRGGVILVALGRTLGPKQILS